MGVRWTTRKPSEWVRDKKEELHDKTIPQIGKVLAEAAEDEIRSRTPTGVTWVPKGAPKAVPVTTYNLIKSNENITLGGVNYIASGFTFTLPEKGGNQQDIPVTINNVSSDIITELENALNTPEEAVSLVYRTFISTDINTVQFQVSLNLQEITFQKYTISGRATNVNLLESIFPSERFDSWKFKGLTI